MPRGRPRLDRPKIDLGTPELILKRSMASPVDHTLSTSPIDVLKARGVISDEAHTAATYWAALRKIVFGKAHPGAIDLTAISSAAMPDELDRADAEIKYRDACAAVKSYSRAALNSLENIVIHEIYPAWINAKGPDCSAYRTFSLGMAALLGWYRGKNRKRVDAIRI